MTQESSEKTGQMELIPGLAEAVPKQWTVVTIDLFGDAGPMTLTGIAPTAIDGPALFDSIELLRSLQQPGQK